MKKYAFGVDVGGTTCKMGLFKTEGTLLEKWEIPTDTTNRGENILKDIAKAVQEKIAEQGISADEVQGIGLGIPGPVTKDGNVNKCVNLGWDQVIPVEEKLAEISGFPVKAGNDANVAALGENWMGSGKEFASMVMVTLGTGIGGGIILDNKILAGANGAAGETRHINADTKETVPCNCGLCGCIEQYASATGIVNVAKKQLAKTTEKSVLRNIGKLSAKAVFDAAREGDDLANKIADEVCDKLAQTIAAVCCVVNPEAIIIGGGVSRAGAVLIDRVTRDFQKKAFHACRDTRILTAKLGNDAGMYGAAKLIIEK